MGVCVCVGGCSSQQCRSIKFLLATLLAAATGGYQEFEMLRRKMRRRRRMRKMWQRVLYKEPKQWFTSHPGVMLSFFPGPRKRRWRTRRKSSEEEGKRDAEGEGLMRTSKQD